jgi:hypothetical protein
MRVDRVGRLVTAFVTAGAGFLLAVLWFDLMFDVQVLRHPGRELPAEALESISAYYRRVTTGARPMNLLIGAVMAAMVGAIAAQIATDDVANWAGWASLALGGSAMALAATHTYPAAVRLGQRAGPVHAQMRLARLIGRDHLLCLAAIVSLLAIQLAAGG